MNAETIQELHAAHKSCINKKHAYKINALILLGTDWTLEEVSEALLMDTETLRKYINDYRAGGISQLLSTNYKGSQPKLSDDQIQKLCIELDTHIHLSTKTVCDYIKTEFNVEYTISGLTDLLRRLDYVYKKPKLVPSNPDVEAQEMFLKYYTDFMKNKPKNEAVFFVDAVHPVHNTIASYGWIKKGKEKELKSNSGRSRLNIHGAMNAETLETVVVAGEDNVNADSTIQLFEYLESLYPLAVVIYVILDNARYHFSESVQEWLETSKIKLVFLPAYSPELNLIERLWRIFKKNVMYNKYYETFTDFKDACMSFFQNQGTHYEEVASIMGAGLEALC